MKKAVLGGAMLLFGMTSCVSKTTTLKPLNVVCLGDSITYGHTLSNREKESYPSILRSMSKGVWTVMNYGVNGATVLNKGDIPITAQEAYEDALAAKPDVVVLMLGTNDVKDGNWQKSDDFVSDYVALVRMFQKLPSRPRVISCSIPPIFTNYPNGLTAERAQSVNSMLKEAVTESGVESLDIYTPLSRKPTFFTDGVHPNKYGAREMAALVFDKITSINGP